MPMKGQAVSNPLDEAGTVPSLDGFYSKEEKEAEYQRLAKRSAELEGKEVDELTDDEIDEEIAFHRLERDRYEAEQRAKEERAKKKAAKGPAKPRAKRSKKLDAALDKALEEPTPDELVEQELAKEAA